MTTVTANDVRALAVSELDRPVLALAGDEVVLVAEAEVPEGGRVILTHADLVQDLGVEVTEIEAELLAGRLTADLTPG
jgi:hypothetical protein